jgi:hypothetical protein
MCLPWHVDTLEGTITTSRGHDVESRVALLYLSVTQMKGAVRCVKEDFIPHSKIKCS